MYDNLHGPQENSLLWNAMIHPFLNMTIYGAIWYQGQLKYRTTLNIRTPRLATVVVLNLKRFNFTMK